MSALAESAFMNLLSSVTINGGGDIIHTLLVLLIVGICILLIWWAGKYFLGQFGAPAVALKVWDGLFVLLGIIFIINLLLSFVGHPFIEF